MATQYADPFSPSFFTLEQPYGPAGRVENGVRVWETFHTGDDFAMPVGTPIIAPRDGVVHTNTNWTLPGHPQGWATSISMSDGNTLLFGHVSKFAVNNGQHVKAGDVIAYSGGKPGTPGAGFSTGPHVHVELHPGGAGPSDPYSYLSAVFHGGTPPAAAGGGLGVSAGDVAAAAGSLLPGVGTIISAIPDPTSGVSGAINNVAGVLATIGNYIAEVWRIASNRANWWRAGFTVIGAAMMIAGVFLYFDGADKVTGTATRLASVGELAAA